MDVWHMLHWCYPYMQARKEVACNISLNQLWTFRIRRNITDHGWSLYFIEEEDKTQKGKQGLEPGFLLITPLSFPGVSPFSIPSLMSNIFHCIPHLKQIIHMISDPIPPLRLQSLLGPGQSKGRSYRVASLAAFPPPRATSTFTVQAETWAVTHSNMWDWDSGSFNIHRAAICWHILQKPNDWDL